MRNTRRVKYIHFHTKNAMIIFVLSCPPQTIFPEEQWDANYTTKNCNPLTYLAIFIRTQYPFGSLHATGTCVTGDTGDVHQERRIDNGGGDDDNTIKDISNNMNAHFVVRRGGAFWTAGNRIIWTQFLFNIKYCIIRRLKARLKSSWALPTRSTRAHKNIHTQMKWVRRQGCRSHTVR